MDEFENNMERDHNSNPEHEHAPKNIGEEFTGIQTKLQDPDLPEEKRVELEEKIGEILDRDDVKQVVDAAVADSKIIIEDSNSYGEAMDVIEREMGRTSGKGSEQTKEIKQFAYLQIARKLTLKELERLGQTRDNEGYNTIFEQHDKIAKFIKEEPVVESIEQLLERQEEEPVEQIKTSRPSVAEYRKQKSVLQEEAYAIEDKIANEVDINKDSHHPLYKEYTKALSRLDALERSYKVRQTPDHTSTPDTGGGDSGGVPPPPVDVTPPTPDFDDGDDDSDLPEGVEKIGEGKFIYNGSSGETPLKPDTGVVSTPREEAEVQRRAEDRLQERGERREGPLRERLRGLPAHKQLEIVREALLEVESVKITSVHFTNAKEVGELDRVLTFDVLDDEDGAIAREIEARLALHDCGVMWRKARGKINNKEKDPNDRDNTTILKAISDVMERERGLDGTRLETILKKGAMPDYEVGYAWDLLQDLNFERNSEGVYYKYAEYIDKINIERYKKGLELIDTKLKQWKEDEESFGEADTNFLMDMESRKKVVTEEVIKDIAIKVKLSLSPSRKEELELRNPEEEQAYAIRIARQSYNMAENLIWATGERSALNRDLHIGPDQLSDCIGLESKREAVDKRDGLAGPTRTINRIKSLGNSWIRERLNRKGDFSPLKSSDILAKTHEISSNSYESYARRVEDFIKVRDLLLERNHNPTTMLDPDMSWFKEARSSITTVDPEGGKNLEFWLILGMMDVQLNAEMGRQGVDWDAQNFLDLERLCLEVNSKGESFVTQKQWNEIARVVGYTKHSRGQRNLLIGLFGKKKR